MRRRVAGSQWPEMHRWSSRGLRARAAERPLGGLDDELAWLGAAEHPLLARAPLPAPVELKADQLLPITGRGARAFKRFLDLGVVLVGAVPALLLTFLAALLVVLLDRQRPFYADRRIGRDAKPFWCFKLRTMRCPPGLLERYFVEHPHEALLYERERKLQSDPRITPLGRWLRKLSIDELPQIWNVALGHMSIVGPRPLSEREFEARSTRDRILLAVTRPGLTCLWQVSGRNDVGLDERLALDRTYVQAWSPWLELKTILATPLAVVGGRGAR